MLRRLERAEATGWVEKITRHIPPGQFGRYLLVGAGNTLFGYCTFALFTLLLNPLIAHAYVVASVLSGLVNITFSYLNYKWFVFKTKGNYLCEWARCVAVYGGAILIGAALLPIIVFFIRRTVGLSASAPYIAGALVIGFTTVYSFMGHKNFSFRQPE